MHRFPFLVALVSLAMLSGNAHGGPPSSAPT